jgi:hypothetical protein
MGTRHRDARRIKIHRNYTVEEIARILSVHKHTVRRWERAGLRAIDDGRPKLFRGDVTRDFLVRLRDKDRRPCGPGQMYCFRCRSPKAPYGGLADLLPLTAKLATLRGICECQTLMHRRVSHRTIRVAARGLAATLQEVQPRLGESVLPNVNAALADIWRPYAETHRTQ